MDHREIDGDDAQTAWSLLRACAALAPRREETACLGFEAGRVLEVPSDDARALLRREGDGRWRLAASPPGPVTGILALYLPLCRSGPVTVGHLGQSLDGFVATAAGDSVFVNDPSNIVHLHRMRALCDAVVVGGATVRDDNPRLTTRRVPGANPLRVVIDPRRELDPGARVFTDGEAATLRVSTVAVPADDPHALRVGEDAEGRPDLAELLAGLRARGCDKVFVEGGGITVSRFLQAGLLDRLQIAVAPFLIGSGRPGLRLPGTDALAQCPRPAHRIFRMGADVLFDLDLRAPEAPLPDAREAQAPVIF